MKRNFVWFVLFLFAVICAAGLRQPAASAGNPPAGTDLVGQWRSSVRFKSGAYASIKDFEFMYAFNAGGTMTESSNYDEAPPVPPAYGIWRMTGPRQYECKYEFYITAAPAGTEKVMNSGGWTPAGRGVLLEKITLSEDGKSFSSTIRYDGFDTAGKPTKDSAEATGHGTKLTF